MTSEQRKPSIQTANRTLKDASFEGDFDLVVICLEVYGAEINAFNGAPLRFAIKNNTFNGTRIARYLLKKGALAHFKNHEALSECCLRGNIELLKLIFKFDPSSLERHNIFQRVTRSLRESAPDVISLLLSYGVSPSVLLDFTPTDSSHVQGPVMDRILDFGGSLTESDGKHALYYFQYLKKPPYTLFEMFDKPVHPYILEYMGQSMNKT